MIDLTITSTGTDDGLGAHMPMASTRYAGCVCDAGPESRALALHSDKRVVVLVVDSDAWAAAWPEIEARLAVGARPYQDDLAASGLFAALTVHQTDV